jgi:hypothetical protein
MWFAACATERESNARAAVGVGVGALPSPLQLLVAQYLVACASDPDREPYPMNKPKKAPSMFGEPSPLSQFMSVTYRAAHGLYALSCATSAPYAQRAPYAYED